MFCSGYHPNLWSTKGYTTFFLFPWSLWGSLNTLGKWNFQLCSSISTSDPFHAFTKSSPLSWRNHQHWGLLSYSPQLFQSVSLLPLHNLYHPIGPSPVWILFWEHIEFSTLREFNMQLPAVLHTPHPPLSPLPGEVGGFCGSLANTLDREGGQLLHLRFWVSVVETKSLLFSMAIIKIALHPFVLSPHPHHFISSSCFPGLVVSVVIQHRLTSMSLLTLDKWH